MKFWMMAGSLALVAVAGSPVGVSAQEVRYPVKLQPIHVYQFPAQTVNVGNRIAVSGRVRDREGRPLAGVEVVAMALGRVAVTDDRGGFRLDRVPEGTYEFQIRDQGFELTQRTVTVDPNLTALEFSIAALGPTWCLTKDDRRDTACPTLVKGARAAER
jgi:hypothetical protein